MSFHWTRIDDTEHLLYSPAPGLTKHAGYVQRVQYKGVDLTSYGVCLMAGPKWEWEQFNDPVEARAWLEVSARMIYAS